MNGRLVGLILGEMAFVAFVLWLAAGFVRDRTRQRTELQIRMIDRFGTAPELIAFLATDAGRGTLPALADRRDTVTRQILFAVLFGIVLIATGGGLAFAARLRTDADIATWAVGCTAAGAGLLVAAFVTRRLARAWAAQDADLPRA